MIVGVIGIVFLIALIGIVVAQETVYCEDSPQSSNCVCSEGEKTVIPCVPSENGGCAAVVIYGCVAEFNIDECVAEWESKNFVHDSYDLELGELSYSSGKVLVGYDWNDEVSKPKAEEVLESYGLEYEDLGSIGFTVTVPVGSEFEWLCASNQDEEFTYAELDTIYTGSPGEVGTCDAYWEGYVYNSESSECKLEGASGCNNPFDYSTKEECESVGGIQWSNLIYWIVGIGVLIVLLIVIFLLVRKMSN